MPYLSPDLDGEKLLVGANFASAGVGILNDTGANIIRITKQLHYFEQYQQRLSSLVGDKQAKRLVNNALVPITLGGNDFINNYYLLPYSARSREFSLPDYIPYLISEYEKILPVACCGQGPYNGIGLCTMLSNLCPDKDIYAFWDAFHPSERANRIIVNQIMTGSKEYMNPMNLSTILTMDARI